jgi:hypothetical protein
MCYWFGWVGFRAQEESALESALCVGQVEVQPVNLVSSQSADSLQTHFCKDGSVMFFFVKALLGVCVLQLVSFDSQET